MYKKILKEIWYIPRRVLSLGIFLYQKTLSPDHGPLKAFFPHGYCRFYPTCSEYARKALQKNGFIIGTIKTLWRILRCNPWSKGGVDLP
ncbi:MAG: membrane protein insertion efficiency factor YidD [Candidatus Magasanikbacteria bacterium CG11_big_fil_rev_8_21_14_0_20_39_34]|uniref:Putative membrane protein insertion efficiency factor n=1 Tax=Candidatus Magasanikbacteria bacterium CG11_big_fil_rev_8_21_14_0_20_39_34 TaxID=1974653 RepID=A0A2H0N6P3_9BACT|nr:MAG: membrane protein insertion efficiency factor YidD [Candidatus Magasanikbacteria bacterium CG11_big_fil_rev_8_21_14_0_20_39_34]